MRIVIHFCCCCIVGLATADAQVLLEHPNQFYTNGETVDGWTRNDQQGLASTFWLVKNPANSLSYRQQVVIVYDSEPNEMYYYDVVSELFIGRYDMETGKYSLLPKQHRRKRLADIDESMFPPPGDKPLISEMFEPLNEGLPNNEQMMMPPATMEFPRLTKSEWKGFYTDIGSNRRRKMTLTLNGRQGRYQAPSVNIAGDLTDVRYETRDDMPVISGYWSAGSGSGGGFEFRFMNLHEFEGEYWVGNNRNRRFLWDGKRVSR